jgi:hypothetical protein
MPSATQGGFKKLMGVAAEQVLYTALAFACAGRDVERFVFIDESGDLGLSPRSSRHLVLAAVVTSNPNALRKIVRRARQRFLSKKLASVPELKWRMSSPRLRQKVLSMIRAADCDAMLLVYRKSKQADEIKPAWLYAALCTSLAKELSSGERLLVTVDKSLKKSDVMVFDRLLKASFKKPAALRVRHVASHDEPCLQIADFVAGAVFDKYEHGTTAYYELIKPRIKVEKEW